MEINFVKENDRRCIKNGMRSCNRCGNMCGVKSNIICAVVSHLASVICSK